jgi:prepilin-type processing-associated H-X9-DG protein
MHLLFAVLAVGIIVYALPKDAPPLLGIWQYSPRYDKLVIGLLYAFPLVAFVLCYFARPPYKRKTVVRLLLILLIEIAATGPLLPVRRPARELGNRVKCVVNLWDIGQALQRYAAAHGRRLPDRFADLLTMDKMTPAVFVCPYSDDTAARGDTFTALAEDFARPHHCSYLYYGTGLSAPLPHTCVVASERPDNHGREGINVLYGDGSVGWVAMPEAEQLLAQLGYRSPPSTLTTAP